MKAWRYEPGYYFYIVPMGEKSYTLGKLQVLENVPDILEEGKHEVL